MTQISQKSLTENIVVRDPAWVSFHNGSASEPVYGHNFPIWRSNLIPTIQRDPRIRYGLLLLKGPIQAFTSFHSEEDAENPVLHETVREQGIQFLRGVKCKNKEQQQFILDMHLCTNSSRRV